MVGPAQSLTEVSVLPYTDVLAWVVVAAFLAGALAEWQGYRGLARQLTVGAWGLFSLFWLLLIPHFAFVHRSIVETVLIVVAVPGCLYVGWHLWRGRDTLLVLSRAVALMGAIYLPFQAWAPARGFLIETVAWQTTWVIEGLGMGDGMALVEDPAEGSTLVNTFWFPGSGRASRLVFQCTGIGSLAIFGGLVGAVQAPLRRKAVALAVSLSTIWVLNVLRNAFIAMANGYQWFAYEWLEGPIMFAFGLSDPARVSFFVADRVISQVGAVFALLALAWFISRWVPEIVAIGEELLFLLTGDEVTLPTPGAPPEDDVGAPGGD